MVTKLPKRTKNPKNPTKAQDTGPPTEAKPCETPVKCKCSPVNCFIRYRAKRWKLIPKPRPRSAEAMIRADWDALGNEERDRWVAYAEALNKQRKMDCPVHGAEIRLAHMQTGQSLAAPPAPSSRPTPVGGTSGTRPSPYSRLAQNPYPRTRPEHRVHASRRTTATVSPLNPAPAQSPTLDSPQTTGGPAGLLYASPWSTGATASSSALPSNCYGLASSASQPHPYPEQRTYPVDEPQEFLAPFTWGESSAAAPHDFPAEHGAHAQPASDFGIFLHPSPSFCPSLPPSHETAPSPAPPPPQSQPPPPHYTSAWDKFWGQYGVGPFVEPAAATGSGLGSPSAHAGPSAPQYQSLPPSEWSGFLEEFGLGPSVQPAPAPEVPVSVSPAASAYPPGSVARGWDRTEPLYPSVYIRFNPYSRHSPARDTKHLAPPARRSRSRTHDVKPSPRYLAPPAPAFASRSPRPLPCSQSRLSASPHTLSPTYLTPSPYSQLPGPPTPDLIFAGSPASRLSSGSIGTPYMDFGSPVEVPAAPGCREEISIDALFRGFCTSFFPNGDGASRSAEDFEGLGYGAEGQ